MEHAFENVTLLLATGQGRSGTTVLTRAIAEHPDIYSNRVESNVMKDVLLAGSASTSMPSRVRQMVLSRDEHDLLFRRMLLHLLFPASQWLEARAPAALSTFSAMNTETAEYGVSVFPDIHFANIVRHGVEVVASRMVHRVLARHSFREHCLAWKAAREMAEWGKNRDCFTLVRHESLLDPDRCQETFDCLFQRAGLRKADRCARYVAANRRNQTQYESECEEDQADLARRKERWRLWTSEQKETFRKICGETMEYFGYALPE